MNALSISIQLEWGPLSCQIHHSKNVNKVLEKFKCFIVIDLMMDTSPSGVKYGNDPCGRGAVILIDLDFYE